MVDSAVKTKKEGHIIVKQYSNRIKLPLEYRKVSKQKRNELTEHDWKEVKSLKEGYKKALKQEHQKYGHNEGIKNTYWIQKDGKQIKDIKELFNVTTYWIQKDGEQIKVKCPLCKKKEEEIRRNNIQENKDTKCVECGYEGNKRAFHRYNNKEYCKKCYDKLEK